MHQFDDNRTVLQPTVTTFITRGEVWNTPLKYKKGQSSWLRQDTLWNIQAFVDTRVLSSITSLISTIYTSKHIPRNGRTQYVLHSLKLVNESLAKKFPDNNTLSNIV